MLETRIAKELAYISQAGLARRITELYFVNPAQAQDRTGKTYLVKLQTMKLTTAGA